MKRILVILAFLAALQAWADEKVLTGADVIELVTGNNAAVSMSAAGEDIARGIYEQVLGAGRPGVSFTTDTFAKPLYGYNNSAFTTGAFTQVVESHSLSAGFSLRQMLPTGGSASLSVNNAMTYSRSGAEDAWEITQDPGLELSVFQPVFVNGKPVDPSVMKSSRRSSEIGWELARVKDLDTRNRILIGVLATVHRVAVLRDTGGLLEEGLDLAVLRLEMGKQDRDRGRISESDLLAIELSLGRQREALFDVRYQLALAELDLAGMLGLEDVSGYTFKLDYGPLEPLLGEADTPADLSGNPAALQAALDAEQKELSARLNGLDEAPVVSLVFKAGPRYPDTRADETDPAASFTDLFSEDADVDISFGLALQFDAWDGGVSKARRQTDEAALTLARESLAEAERAVRQERRSLLAQLRLLNERIELLESNIDYDRRLLQREIDRQALGASTKVDVETVRLEMAGRELDVESLTGERYLLGLQLLALTGAGIEEYLQQ